MVEPVSAASLHSMVRRVPMILSLSCLRRRYVLAAFLVLAATPQATTPQVGHAQQPAAPAMGTTASAAPAGPVAALPTPALSTMPARGISGARITLQLPPGGAVPPRARVALFETGGRALAGDLRRDAKDWQMADGRAQLPLQIDAAPGRYEIALVTDDKARTRLPYAAATIEIAGIGRAPGWWLPGGSPFGRAANSDETAEGAPLFIPGLQRSQGKKLATPSVSYAPDAPFKVLPLDIPAAAWTAGYDAAPLRAALQVGLTAAAAKNERGFWGVGIVLQDVSPLATLADATRVAAMVRDAVAAAAPSAALILVQRANDLQPDIGRAEQNFAARCDAVFVRTYLANLDTISWTTKQIRRVAEEQPGYDLPIVVEMPPSQGYGQRLLWTGAAQLEVLLAGATTLVRTGGYSIDLGGAQPVFDSELPAVIERNRALFVNSVTLEDMGLLPAPDGGRRPNRGHAHPQLELYNAMRGAGRIPLLARVDSEDPESLAVSLGDRVADKTVLALKNLAERGTRIYIEGAPTLDETGKAGPWKLKDLVGADIKPLGGEAPRAVEMSLDDGWTFGTGRGTRVGVLQSVAVTLAPPSTTSNIKSEKGIYRPVGARVAAKLADGTPGLIINTLGRGEVVWLPHEIAAAPPTAWTDLRQAPAAKPVSRPRISPDELYYAAIGAYVQPGLVSLRSARAATSSPDAAGVKTAETKPAAVDAAAASASPAYSGAANVRVALRRSAQGTLLLGLFNDEPRAARIEATVDGAAGIALDLRNEAVLPLDQRGFASTTTVTIPARGWSLIAFAKSREALTAERAAPLAKATLR